MGKIKKTIVGVVILCAIIFFQSQVFAVSSFSRLYNMSCTACHSTTPRLNYFGEKLMLVGYELDRMSPADQPAEHPDVEKGVSCTSCHNDGSKGAEVGAKEISSALVLHEISNLLSLRVKFTPLEAITNGQVEGGENKTRIKIGNPNHIQFWVAGPVAKNIGVRAEVEESDGHTTELHNFAVAFSNLFNSDGLLNIRVGGFTHGEWLSISNQKRAFSPHFNIYGVKSAAGNGEDTYKVGGAEPAVEGYGFKGPIVYQAGVSNGKSPSDANTNLNYWGTVKLYVVTSGKLAGTNISGSYITGTDSKVDSSGIQKDDFLRYVGSVCLRYGPIDIAGAYVMGEDKNWDLATDLNNKFSGGFVQVLYTLNEKISPGVIYQYTTADPDSASLSYNHVLGGVNFYIRENHFLSAYYDTDLSDKTDKQNSFVLQYRAMF